MGKSHSKNNEMMVYGYVRHYEKKSDYVFPQGISSLVLLYYPDANVYGIGRNGLSEFGLGDFRRLHRFERLTHITSRCDDPTDVYVGDHRFAVKSIHGAVYCAGKNTNNECGVSGPDMLKSLERVKGIDPKDDQFISVVSSGLCSRHTFVVFNDNTLHAFGWNQYGQFGNGKQNAYAKVHKMKLQNHWRVKEIATGSYHTLFLTSDGTVYCAGMNQAGQCGIPQMDYMMNCVLTMIPIPGLSDIISVACGDAHSLALCRDGKVYVFGDNQDGQLGFENEDLDHLFLQTPTLQTSLDERECNIGIIRCGTNHSLFVDTEAKKGYLCGNNVHGQIGNNKKDESQIFEPWCFEWEDYSARIVDGSCGARHTVLITDVQNVLLSFGSNTNHQCSAYRDEEYIWEPHTITASEMGIKHRREAVKKVICGNDTTIVTTSAF